MIELGAAAHKRTVLRHRNGDALVKEWRRSRKQFRHRNGAALVRSGVATCMKSCAAEVAVRLPDDFLARSENPSLLLHFLVIAHSNHVGNLADSWCDPGS